MTFTGLAGSTALKAITNATAMAEKYCFLILTKLDVFASFDLMWFCEPLDICKTLEHIFVNFLRRFSVFEKLLGLIGCIAVRFKFLNFAVGAFFAGARLDEAWAGSEESDSASVLFLRQSDSGAFFSFGCFGIGFGVAFDAGLPGDFFSGFSDSEDSESVFLS